MRGITSPGSWGPWWRAKRAAAGERPAPRHAAQAGTVQEPGRLPPAVPAGQEDDIAAREREITAAHAPCKTAPNGSGALCDCEFACANYWLRAVREGRPSWAPRKPQPAAMTAPMPVVPASPLDHGTPQWPGTRAVIGDLMNKEYPAPPAPQPGPPGPALALPYAQPGWTGLQMTRWIEQGEWEPADAALPAGYERNAADMAVALVRSRARAVEALTRGCDGLGLPGLAAVLWQRAEELTRADRAAALRKAAEEDLAEAGAAHRRQGAVR